MTISSRPNQVVFHYFNEFIKHAVNIDHEKYDVDKLFSERPEIPDPIKYELDTEIFEYLLEYYDDVDQIKSKSTSEILIKIIDNIESKNPDSYVQYLILVCCLFMLDENKRAIKYCLKVFELYGERKINYYEYKFVADVFGYICLDVLPCDIDKLNILIILSFRDQLANDIKEFEKVTSQLMNDFKDKFIYTKLVASDFDDWNDLVSDLKPSEFDLIICMAHGNKENGLILKFKNDKAVSMTNIELRDSQNLLSNKNNPIILLGCEGNRYMKTEYDFCNRIYTTNVWSKPENQYFLYGFLKAFERCNDFYSSFYSGRISLMIGAHSNYRIQFSIGANATREEQILNAW